MHLKLSSTGDDTNVDIKITPKGSGNVVLDGIKFPNADGTTDQVLKTDGAGNLSFGEVSGGESWQTVKTSGNFTAVARRGLFYVIQLLVQHLLQHFQHLHLLGDFITFIDYAGTFDTNNLTIARNGKNIQGAAEDLTVSIERSGFTLVFVDDTQGWLLKNK
jgi:hypothetical protein